MFIEVRVNKTGINSLIFVLFFRGKFQYDSEPVLIQRRIIRLEAILVNILLKGKAMEQSLAK